jgi:hypothetical protein
MLFPQFSQNRQIFVGFSEESHLLHTGISDEVFDLVGLTGHKQGNENERMESPAGVQLETNVDVRV